ncbi:MAG TPA: isocitrate lyase/phosphoenolpyruvate mutase family protein [Jiangellaceae bacterium]
MTGRPDPAQVVRAAQLRSLHVSGRPLRLVNVWDVASAQVVAAQPATMAIATASWSISAAHGVPDGEGLALDDLLVTVERICRAVSLPVTADLERGHGRTPDDVAVSIRRLIDTGAVGCNIEDSVAADDPGGTDGLRDLADQVARLRAVRSAADAAGVPIVLNARTDVLVSGGDTDDAVARGLAYLDAGADCVFALGAADLGDVRKLTAAFDGRLSLMAWPGMPSADELAEAGVSRISVGPGPMRAAYTELARVAAEIAATGVWPEAIGARLPMG